MNRVPSDRTKILIRVGIVALILLFMALFLLFFLGLISGRIPYIADQIVFLSLMGVMGIAWLFSGIKKFREGRRNGQRVTWYTQPIILLGLANLFFLPAYIVFLVTGAAFPNAVIIIPVLFVPVILLFLASAFFFIKADDPIV